MKREFNIERDSINKENQTANKYIEISFNHHIDCLFKADIDFECNSSVRTTSHYKSQRPKKLNTTKITSSKFLN